MSININKLIINSVLPASIFGGTCLINTFISLSVNAEVSNLTECGSGSEDDSKLARTIVLQNFGISIQFPANYRAIALTDGSVKIIDNGIYKSIVCSNKIPGYIVHNYGEYDFWLIKKSHENFLYSNVYDKLTGTENVFIVVKKNPIDRNYTSFEYEIKLRVKTKTGFTEVEKIMYDLPVNDENFSERIKELIELGKSIKAL